MTNKTNLLIFVYLFNISLVFFIATVFSSCPDPRIIEQTAAAYAIIAALLLIYVNLTGSWILGRLSTDGIHPNFWGLIAASVGVTALSLQYWIVSGSCWLIASVTLINTSSRGSMVAVLAGLGFVAARWLVKSKHSRLALPLIGAVACIVLLIFSLELYPQFVGLIQQDVLKLDDPHRGLSTGLTGRTEVWAEAFRLWIDSPLFGVGFRQHEARLTTGSSAHNAYLTMLVDTGILGLVVYVALVAASLRASCKDTLARRTQTVVLAVIVSYAVLGLFERRALNGGNPFSIWFIICCYYALKSGPVTHSHLRVQGKR